MGLLIYTRDQYLVGNGNAQPQISAIGTLFSTASQVLAMCTPDFISGFESEARALKESKAPLAVLFLLITGVQSVLCACDLFSAASGLKPTVG